MIFQERAGAYQRDQRYGRPSMLRDFPGHPSATGAAAAAAVAAAANSTATVDRDRFVPILLLSTKTFKCFKNCFKCFFLKGLVSQTIYALI